jgi:hypothetical protein
MKKDVIIRESERNPATEYLRNRDNQRKSTPTRTLKYVAGGLIAAATIAGAFALDNSKLVNLDGMFDKIDSDATQKANENPQYNEDGGRIYDLYMRSKD